MSVLYDAARVYRSVEREACQCLRLLRSICFVHHIVSRSSLLCVDADDFSKRTSLPDPDFFPDLDSEYYRFNYW